MLQRVWFSHTSLCICAGISKGEISGRGTARSKVEILLNCSSMGCYSFTLCLWDTILFISRTHLTYWVLPFFVLIAHVRGQKKKKKVCLNSYFMNYQRGRASFVMLIFYEYLVSYKLSYYFQFSHC